MTIMVELINGRACPLFHCDVCGKRIREPHLAMAALNNLQQSVRNEDPEVRRQVNDYINAVKEVQAVAPKDEKDAKVPLSALGR
jgi:hypothetical protein